MNNNYYEKWNTLEKTLCMHGIHVIIKIESMPWQDVRSETNLLVYHHFNKFNLHAVSNIQPVFAASNSIRPLFVVNVFLVTSELT